MAGLFLGLVLWYSIYLYSDQGVYNRAFLLIHLRQLLPTYHLMNTNISIPGAICLSTNHLDCHVCFLNLYGQAQWSVSLAILRFLWTELSAAISHEARLQDVATATILPEQPIVQIHLQTSSLEVQSHFKEER